jgi:hypothetical protein
LSAAVSIASALLFAFPVLESGAMSFVVVPTMSATVSVVVSVVVLLVLALVVVVVEVLVAVIVALAVLAVSQPLLVVVAEFAVANSAAAVEAMISRSMTRKSSFDAATT